MFTRFFRSNFNENSRQINQNSQQREARYNFSSDADEAAVQFSYMYLLDREAENETAIESALSIKRSVRELKRDTLSSIEYRNVLKEQAYRIMLQQYLTCKSEQIDNGYCESESSDDMVLLQTADHDRYATILHASGYFNEIYAKNNKMIYQNFVGIKRGMYPHHAMYNRTHLLQEMVLRNFTGWVLYIDADAIIDKPDFDVNSHLKKLRADKKCMTLHNVFRPNEEKYHWWDVNSGTFAIDLSSNRARLLVEAWAGIYTDLYTMDDYRAATVWSDRFVIDDQNALWHILRQFDMQPHVDLTEIQGPNGYTRQFGREDGISIGSDDDLQSRILRINELGRSIYKSQPDKIKI